MSRRRLVLVNGPPGVGKTSVSSALAQLGRNVVCIRGDDLRRWIVKREDPEIEKGLAYVNGAMAAGNYLRAGYELVIFEYVFEHPRHVQRFLEHLGVDARGDVFLFTLWAPLAIVLQRERARPGRDRLSRRVIDCHAAMGTELPRLGVRVDTVARTPEEIAAHLLALCEAGVGRLRTALS